VPSFIPIENPDLEVVVDALIRDVTMTSSLSGEEATDLVHRRVQDHLGFLYSAGQDEPVPQILAWVLEAVQEDIIEGDMNLPRPVVWPYCPDHPNHPLSFRPEGSPDAAWTCPTTGRVIAALGRL
jgi:hypothetical protein